MVEMVYATKDADGRYINVGDPIRLRLSRLKKYGVNENDRHGQLRMISQNDSNVVAIEIEAGDYIVGTDDIRSNEPNEPDVLESDEAAFDCGSPTCSICHKSKVGVDADGTEVNIGTSIRVRLSKLTKYAKLGVGVNAKDKKPDGRDGTVFGIADDGSLAVTLFNGEHFVFLKNDVRVNQ